MAVKKNKKRGVSLLELMIAIPIIAIMVVAFSTIYITSLIDYQQQITLTNLESDGQSITDGIDNNIRLAGSVQASYNAYTSGNQTVILEVPAMDTNENFIYSGNNLVFDSIIYYLNGTTLHRLIIANAASSRYPQNNVDTILTNQVTGLTFTYTPAVATASTVGVSLTLAHPVDSDTNTITVSTKAKLRNP